MARCSEIRSAFNEAFFHCNAKKKDDLGVPPCDWLDTHAEVRRKITPIKGTGGRWGMIECVWKTHMELVKGKLVDTPKGFMHRQSLKAPIYLKPGSKSWGNIYNNDSYGTLYLKFVLLILGRAVHAIAKVIYHITLIALAVELIKGIKNKLPPKELAARAFQSLADIFRTPYYSAVMGGAALIGAIGGIFKRTFLYDCRQFTHKQLDKLYWGRRSGWDISPCMWRLANIRMFEKYPDRQRVFKDTYYKHPENLTLRGLANLARKELPRPVLNTRTK